MREPASLRRLGRGLFDYPRINPRLGGELSPNAGTRCPGRRSKRGGRISPSGAYAANALGLSTQVPGKALYVTDAAGGSVKVGRQTITFKRVTPKRVAARHKMSSTVFQAFEHLGRDGVDDGVIRQLRTTLSPGTRRPCSRRAATPQAGSPTS